MANIERFGLFYAPWPVIDGKPINYQWGEIRHDTAETKAIVRGSFQELQDGQEELNALRALLGQAYGDLAFSNRYRFYYNKSTLEFCLQKNDGTVDSPTWTDVWCIRLTDGQLQVVSSGGILSEAGFYGPDLERIYQIGETGSSAADESFLHRSKLFFNVDDGFELNEISSGGNQGGVEVRLSYPIGRAVEFPKVGKEWAIEHNFGISPVLVQIMDDDKRIIMPDLADVSDPNIAYFYFNEVTSGSAYIASGGVGATSLLPLDPFYLVVRTQGMPAAGHTMEHNADLIFDSRYFYVNVDLDEDGGGSHKNAFISFIPNSDINITGDRNIAVEAGVIRLQPKLGGMEAFYFKNGDEINSNDSINIRSNTDITITAADDVGITATADVNITGNTANVVASSTAEVQAGTHITLRVAGGTGTNTLRLGKDGIVSSGKVKAEAFYFENGANISANDAYAATSIRVDTAFLAIGDDDTGIEHDTDSNGDTLKLRAGSANNLTVTTNGVEIANGNASNPTLNFQGDRTTGLYREVDAIGFTANGKSSAVLGRDGLRVQDKVEATGFYYNPGPNDVGWDLSKASIEIHIPSPTSETPYFLVNFVDQAFIVDDVKLACQAGAAAFGFYTLASGEVFKEGTGIVGTGKDGNTLAGFYVVPAIRTVTASGLNIVGVGGSLKMVCLSTQGSVKNVRGRVSIRLQG